MYVDRDNFCLKIMNGSDLVISVVIKLSYKVTTLCHHRLLIRGGGSYYLVGQARTGGQSQTSLG